MKVTKERFKTMHSVFDEFTNRTLYKLISQRHFDGLVGPVSVGKESNVFLAKKGEQKIIVKIYRLETCDFNRMYDYIKDDPRFFSLKKTRRKVIFAWALREYRNLIKAREAGVRVPTPIVVRNNVLVMSLIGDDEVAPKLKDKFPKEPDKFFLEVIEGIKKAYDAGLVHADLSHFNILNYNEKPVFIDWSHCTPKSNVNSREYLIRDIRTICTFFNKNGCNYDEKEIYKKIVSNNKL